MMEDRITIGLLLIFLIFELIGYILCSFKLIIAGVVFLKAGLIFGASLLVLILFGLARFVITGN